MNPKFTNGAYTYLPNIFIFSMGYFSPKYGRVRAESRKKWNNRLQYATYSHFILDLFEQIQDFDKGFVKNLKFRIWAFDSSFPLP